MKKKKAIKETVEAIVIALVLALIIRTFVIQAFKIPSSSMESTLLVGDHILVSKLTYGIQIPKPGMTHVWGVKIPFFTTTLKPIWGKPKFGDIIVFRFPGDRAKDYIKRVIGVEGDVVEAKNKRVYVNGKAVDDTSFAQHVDTAVFPRSMDPRDNFGPFKVPKDTVFVMGDNRDRSYDSRYWGTVPLHEIKGRAKIIYWSWNSESHWPRFGRIGDLIH
ncbi:MAG: signal peptidase I [Thermodesulfobacteriota bacterium]